MTVAAEPRPAPTKRLTYADHMAEGEVSRRYDIIGGGRILMTQPTDGHQDIVLNLAELLRASQRARRAGKVTISPCNVLITRDPIRTRQPDALFISSERHARRPPEYN